MKNLKIKTKLLLGFLSIAFLTIAVGITGIFGLATTDTIYTEFTTGSITGLSSLGDLRELFQQQRLMLRTMMIDMSDPVRAQADITAAREYEAAMLDAMAVYESTIFDPSAEVDYFTFKEAYLSKYKDVKERFIEAVSKGDTDAATVLMIEAGEVAAPIADSLKGVVDYVARAVDEQSALATDTGRVMNMIQIAVMSLSAVLAIILGLYISSIISVPLGYMVKALTQIGTQGDLELDAETAKSAATEVHRKDEIGLCSRACVGLIEHLRYMEQTLERVAEGDLTTEVKVLSPRDTIGLSVAHVADSLNDIFGEIHTSTEQVAAGSRQIADGSQSLAQGSAEQAAAAEELSSSISEIALNTEENAEMASKAASLAEEIKKKAGQSSRQMDQMMVAVREIGEASRSISKVISVIDDIAFQTNILALNAAVEAARAGQHGKGFAVVAEEVRGLAAKSAEAARDTGNLIENSINKSVLGVSIASETAESLTEIVTGINESDALIRDIAVSSQRQSSAISQINKGIDQVAQVIQKNSATAQESAAASEEMSEQAHALDTMVARFRLRERPARRIDI